MIDANDLSHLPDLLVPQEVADIFRVSKLTIIRWSQTGKLPCIRINSRGDRRFAREDIIKKLQWEGQHEQTSS